MHLERTDQPLPTANRATIGISLMLHPDPEQATHLESASAFHFVRDRLSCRLVDIRSGVVAILSKRHSPAAIAIGPAGRHLA